MANPHCSVWLCVNNTTSNPDLAFFPFPQDKDRCESWKQFSKTNLVPFDPKNNYICVEHFEKYMFQDSDKDCLTENALPTIKTKLKKGVSSSTKPSVRNSPYSRPENSRYNTALVPSSSNSSPPIIPITLYPYSKTDTVQIENVVSLNQEFDSNNDSIIAEPIIHSPNYFSSKNSFINQELVEISGSDEQYFLASEENKKLKNLIVDLSQEIVVYKKQLVEREPLVKNLEDKSKALVDKCRELEEYKKKNFSATLQNAHLLELQSQRDKNMNLKLEEQHRNLENAFEGYKEQLDHKYKVHHELIQKANREQQVLKDQLAKQQALEKIAIEEYKLQIKRFTEQQKKVENDLRHKIEELKSTKDKLVKIALENTSNANTNAQLQLIIAQRNQSENALKLQLSDKSRLLSERSTQLLERQATLDNITKVYKLKEEQMKIKYLEQKDLTEKYKQEFDGLNCTKGLLKKLGLHLPPDYVKLIEKQMLMTKYNVPKELKLLALSIYIQSPVVYRQLRDVFCLPSEGFLNTVIENPEQSGIKSSLLEQEVVPFKRTNEF